MLSQLYQILCVCVSVCLCVWVWFPCITSAIWQIVRVCFKILTCRQVGLIDRRSPGRCPSSSAAALWGPGVAVKGKLFGCQPASCQSSSRPLLEAQPWHYRNIYNYHKNTHFYDCMWCGECFFILYLLLPTANKSGSSSRRMICKLKIASHQ